MSESAPPATVGPATVRPRTVCIVPHTHWDREWYRPFEWFRSQLADVLDDVLDALESDDRWTGFHLDGQVAVLEDYLEARPGARERVHKLVAAGRLGVGPWYVLMDEFCVSGETILRNLEMGMASSRRLGAQPAAGYLPDMFGHVAQMPQILRLAGIADAVVWRGVPSAVRKTAFEWVAPDGSSVRAEYLPVGYASGAFLPQDPEALIRRVEALDAETGGFALTPGAPMLVMNGTDHQGIQAHLPNTIDAANALQDRYRFGLATLAGYLTEAARDEAAGDIPIRWDGELRSGARAPILMGVLSNRRDLKLAAARAERELERVAEPLATLWLPAELWPAPSLDRAWLEMVRNSAHDSICGCSADEVSRAVLHRYDDALALAGRVTDSAVAIAAVAVSAPGPVVLNPTSRSRSALVELTLPGSDAPHGTQQTAAVAAGRVRREGTGRDLGAILGRLALDGRLEVGATPVSATVSAGTGSVELTLGFDGSKTASPVSASVLAEAWALAGANSDSPLAVTVERAASQSVVARVAQVPGYGWKAWEPGDDGVAPVEVGPERIRNGLVDVEIDTEDGTFSIDGHRGFGRLIDEGDAGDTYNYCPPTGDIRVDAPATVEVTAVESGPLRGRLRVTSTYDWPERLEGGQRAGAMSVEVVTDLELRAGERVVRVTTGFVNGARDHRVRILFPLPGSADTTTAECAFSTVERAAAEGGPREPALASYPARRFVVAGGLTVVNEGLVEYELLPEQQALAITALRCTGVLSKPFLTTRPNAAGPPLAVEGAQMLGPVRIDYALAVGDVDPWELADDVLLPMPVVYAPGTGHLPAAGSRLEIVGAEVSALRRREGWIELRLFNPSAATTTVRIAGHRGWFVNLQGEELARWDGSFELGSWKIANVRLEAAALD